MIRTTGYYLERVEKPFDQVALDSHLNAIAQQFASWKQLEAPQNGDRVHVSITFRCGDAQMEAYEDKFILGGGRADAAMEDVILEMSVGQTVERTITTKENPRELWVRVTLLTAERMIPAVLTPKLVRKATGSKNLKEYIKVTRKRMKAASAAQADKLVHQQLFKQLADSYPETPVDEKLVEQLLEGSTFISEEQKLLAEHRARQHVQALELLAQIAAQEGIEATDRQFRIYAAKIAQERKKSMKFVLSKLDRPKVMRYLSQQNAIDFLMKHNLKVSA